MTKSKYESYSKEQLLEKIKQLEKHRYGLVWEDKQEDVAEQCEKELPVLHEDTSKEIKSENALSQNILIEGDNYHALYTLNFTHKKKVDVIYIDPPYNTGNNDFKYNDKYVDREDNYRHSKWISFMSKRLKLAKRLLKDSGVIFISIDDNEIAQLKLICDDLFGENNLVGLVSVAKGTTTGQDAKKFGGSCDYLIVYGMNNFLLGKLDLSEKDIKRFGKKDSKGKYSMLQWRKTGNGDRREDRPNLYYPITAPNGKKVLPLGPTGYESRWRGNIANFKKLQKDEMIEWVKQKDGWKPYVKYYLEGRRKAPGNLWTDIEGNKKATIELKEIFGDNVFQNPKPTDLIKRCIQLSNATNPIILDFFAGSGTTGQAVLNLNDEDDGNRQFILCTNNEVGEDKEKEFKTKYEIDSEVFKKWKSENKKEWLEWCNTYGICSTVTYPRIKKVIKGYNGIKGISANLKYFKTDFVPQVLTDNDKRILVSRSTELLCLAENTFELIKQSKRKLEFAIYKNNKQHTAIIYDEDVIEKCKEELEALKPKGKTIIYVFSYSHEYNVEDFEDLTIKFDVKPIPEAILNVYSKNAKLRRK